MWKGNGDGPDDDDDPKDGGTPNGDGPGKN